MSHRSGGLALRAAREASGSKTMQPLRWPSALECNYSAHNAKEYSCNYVKKAATDPSPLVCVDHPVRVNLHLLSNLIAELCSSCALSLQSACDALPGRAANEQPLSL